MARRPFHFHDKEGKRPQGIQFTTRIEDDLFKKLEAYCRRHDVSRNFAINKALRVGLLKMS